MNQIIILTKIVIEFMYILSLNIIIHCCNSLQTVSELSHEFLKKKKFLYELNVVLNETDSGLPVLIQTGNKK